MKEEIDLELLIDAQTLQERVRALALEINQQLKDQELVLIGVLKGAFIFLSDLFRDLKMPCSCDFLGIRSYDSEGKQGSLQLEFDLSQDIQGKTVLLVEDIVDSGETLNYLLAHLKAKNPQKIYVCTLLHKQEKSPMKLDFVGFEIADHYVLGYGMDLNGLYRNMSEIRFLRK